MRWRNRLSRRKNYFAGPKELFASVITGDKEPWQKYYADDAIFFDEKGRNMDKTALVADISPLPTGYSGYLAKWI